MKFRLIRISFTNECWITPITKYLLKISSNTDAAITLCWSLPHSATGHSDQFPNEILSNTEQPSSHFSPKIRKCGLLNYVCFYSCLQFYKFYTVKSDIKVGIRWRYKQNVLLMKIYLKFWISWSIEYLQTQIMHTLRLHFGHSQREMRAVHTN